MRREQVERIIDGLIVIAAVVLILVLIYTVALRALDAWEPVRDAEPSASTEIQPPREEGKESSGSPAERVPDERGRAAECKSVSDDSGNAPHGACEDAATEAAVDRAVVLEHVEQPDAGAAFYRADVPMVPEHQAAMEDICAVAGVDINLAFGLIQTESNFDPYAVSETGCYGYCQLSGYFPSGLGPKDNLRAGIGWLGELIAQHGDVGKALTVYHLGHDDGTRDYAGVVLRYARAWGYAG